MKDKFITLKGKFKNIDIDSQEYLCRESTYEHDKKYYSCKKLTSRLKKLFLNGTIDSETFEERFKDIWSTKKLEDVKIKTKVFIFDEIKIDGETIGKKPYIYKLSDKKKKTYSKLIDEVIEISKTKPLTTINKGEKYESKVNKRLKKIKSNVRKAFYKTKYGSKMYVILEYLSDELEKKSIPQEKRDEGQKILDKLKAIFEMQEQGIDVQKLFNIKEN